MNDERFKFVGTCNCSGGLSKKYKYGQWMIYIGKYFKVKKNGITVKSKGNLNELEKYISQAIPAVCTG